MKAYVRTSSLEAPFPSDVFLAELGDGRGELEPEETAEAMPELLPGRLGMEVKIAFFFMAVALLFILDNGFNRVSICKQNRVQH